MKENSTITNFVKQVIDILVQMASIREVVEEFEITLMILNNLLESYEFFVQNINS
jgi:hypothetical protein